MNTAVELLRDYLAQKKISQADFAKRCGIEQSLVSRLISGVTPLSPRNLPLLLSGIGDLDIKIQILIAHLQDQLPTEYVSSIEVRPRNPISKRWPVDVDPRKVFADAAAELIPHLPMQTQTEVYRFIGALRTNPALRDILHGLISYLPATNASSPLRSEVEIQAAEASKPKSASTNRKPVRGLKRNTPGKLTNES